MARRPGTDPLHTDQPPGGTDALAGAFVGSDALAGAFAVPDALAGGFAGSDALAVTTEPDALRTPSVGAALAVRATGDMLAAGRSRWSDPLAADPATPVRPVAVPDRAGPGGGERAAGRPAPGPTPGSSAGTTPGGRRSAATPTRRSGPAPATRRSGSTSGTQRGGSTPAARGSGPGQQSGRAAQQSGRAAQQSGRAAQRSGPTWADLQRMAPPPGGRRYGGPPAQTPRPPARPNRTTRPTGTVPWSGGTPATHPQSVGDVARALLDAFRRNLDGPR
jgi:translation initiation factor IF-2